MAGSPCTPRAGPDGASPAVPVPLDEVVAFYLPQFHPTPENDEFWGPGFTEWTNVAGARPLYRGHRQPLLPADLGFYDLRVPEVRGAQAELAHAYGVTAFCYWHYWFAGRRVLDRVLGDVVRTGEPDLPFCLGWGNQSWTGVWHGAPDRVLIEQTYPGADDHRRHFDALLVAFTDPRYLRVDGRPVFYVQAPDSIPGVERWVALWQRLADAAGLGGLFLVGEYHGGPWEPQHHGFDGSVAIRLPTPGGRRGIGRAGRGPNVVSYSGVHATLTSLDDDEHAPCVVPRWDNTPRSGLSGLVLEGSTPESFREHVALAVTKAQKAVPGQRIVWVKSWNEWAEGNTLEPDREFGHGYLEALRDGLRMPREAPPSVREWSHVGDGGLPRLARIARDRAQTDRRILDDANLDRTVPVVLCIDCEPDPRMVDPADPPPLEGYRRVQEFFTTWRERTSELTGVPVHLNWFFRMDPQIATSYGDAGVFVDQHAAFVERVRAAGDGLGVHPHAWRWDRTNGGWVADLANADFVRECLETAVEAFHSSIGHAPELLRFGDAYLDDDVVDAAERAGIRYDLTLEPGQPSRPVPETAEGELATAWLPDWRRVPRVPYQPAAGDYRRPSDSPRTIRLVPLSSGPRWLGRSVRARAAAFRAHGRHGWKQRDPLYMALPYWTGPNSFGEMLRRTLAVQTQPYLAFAIRTDWALRPDHRRNIERSLDALLARARPPPARVRHPGRSVHDPRRLEGCGQRRRAVELTAVEPSRRERETLNDVFIVGAPRSGTTWLQTLLADHPDLASPPELHVFPEFLGPAAKMWDDRARNNAMRRDAGIVDGGSGLENVLDRADFAAWMRDLYEMARSSVLALKPGATRLLEKTPGNARHLPLIREVAPGARFVHVARDPRDVVASLLERSRRPFGDWAPSEVCSATAVWRDNVGAARRDADPQDTLLIRYEDLKADPHGVLRGIADFLGLSGTVESWLRGDPTTEALERARRVVVRKVIVERDGERATRSTSDVFGGPTATALSELERWYVESRCFPEMTELGYQPLIFEPGRRTPRRRAEVALRIRAPRVTRVVVQRAGRIVRAGFGEK